MSLHDFRVLVALLLVCENAAVGPVLFASRGGGGVAGWKLAQESPLFRSFLPNVAACERFAGGSSGAGASTGATSTVAPRGAAVVAVAAQTRAAARRRTTASRLVRGISPNRPCRI